MYAVKALKQVEVSHGWQRLIVKNNNKKTATGKRFSLVVAQESGQS
jgi:hypothetical protein